MKLPNIVSTISFKLSALYLILFLCSFLSIGITIYWLTLQTLEAQLKSSIETEALRLKDEYDSGGLSELKDEIDEVGGPESHTFLEYGVMDQHGNLIAGNLGNFRLSAGWQTIMRVPEANKPKKLLYIKVTALSDAAWLAVGRDGESIRKAVEAVIQAFIWGFALVLIFGASGGFYISGAFLRKIESITESTQAIIAGDLTHRLPVSKHQDELDKLALMLNQMLDRIGSLIENIQQVSNDIAHDLRTPVSRLKLRLERALFKNLTSEQYTECIALAIEEVDTILDTFSAMLRVSQIESGSRRSGFKSVNFSDTVVSVIDALSPVAEEQGKAIHADIGRNVMVDGDKELLTQLVFNLLDNAILHTSGHTQINVRLRSSGTQSEFTVADNGPGIAEAHRPKVFQRFYRLEQSRTTPGNGLGLSIVAAIADLHGGTIALSDNNPGLKVILNFPNRQDKQV